MHWLRLNMDLSFYEWRILFLFGVVNMDWFFMNEEYYFWLVMLYTLFFSCLLYYEYWKVKTILNIYIYIYIYIERKKNFTFFLSGRIRKILLIAIFSRPSGKAWKKGSNGTIPPSPQNERGDLVVLGLWRYVVRCSVFFHWGQT